MRAAVLALAVVMGLAVPSGAGPERDGFDHYLHDRNIAVSGGDPVACATCHAQHAKTGKLVGVPGHGACFGSCHGAPPARLARPATAITDIGARQNVCTACHAEPALRAAVPSRAALVGNYPPYTRFPDFALEAGHQTHAAAACSSCHVKKPQAPHVRCAACHDGSQRPGTGPAMTACQGCHTPASGQPEPLRMVRTAETQIFVTQTFSHAKHATRGGAGAACVTCHAAVRETNDRQLPRVPMAACGVGACHDGAAAFGITEACTKCHRDVPTEKYEVKRIDRRFGHARPGHASAALACRACHSLGPTGEPRVAGHRACVACHAEDFSKRRPVICTACHNGIEPWRPLVPDRAPPARSELGAQLDHAKHPGACEGCHRLATAAVELRPPRGHAACTGAGCHVASGGPLPTLETCDGCHRLGLAAEREAARLAAPWSVRRTFSHVPHQRAADGTALACTSCHTSVRGVTLLDIPAPAKATCAPCHDGKQTFKLTGTTCTRCHPGVK